MESDLNAGLRRSPPLAAATPGSHEGFPHEQGLWYLSVAAPAVWPRGDCEGRGRPEQRGAV
jgi:hypothetical protein